MTSDLLLDSVLLVIAGMLGGIVNTVAGGGSFITFPALMFVGINPVIANATNTFASCAGYLSGAYALRNDIKISKTKLFIYIFIAFIGGGIGAYLLTLTPVDVFSSFVPWLLLFATLIFIFGDSINKVAAKIGKRYPRSNSLGVAVLFILLAIVCIYGGFFNAGLGIVLLSYLALSGAKDVHYMNGMKLLLSAAVSVFAIAIFIIQDLIAWYEGSLVLIGTLLGGAFAANLSKRLPQKLVKILIALVGAGLSVYYFIA